MISSQLSTISLLGEEDSSGNTLTGAKHSNALCHGSKWSNQNHRAQLLDKKNEAETVQKQPKVTKTTTFNQLYAVTLHTYTQVNESSAELAYCSTDSVC